MELIVAYIHEVKGSTRKTLLGLEYALPSITKTKQRTKAFTKIQQKRDREKKQTNPRRNLNQEGNERKHHTPPRLTPHAPV